MGGNEGSGRLDMGDRIGFRNREKGGYGRFWKRRANGNRRGKKWAYTLAPSGAGNGCRSTRVMEVSLKDGLLQREYAVERPKTPLPIIRMDEGIGLSVEPCSFEAIVITWRAECF